jgi:hypothetical protein
MGSNVPFIPNHIRPDERQTCTHGSAKRYRSRHEAEMSRNPGDHRVTIICPDCNGYHLVHPDEAQHYAIHPPVPAAPCCYLCKKPVEEQNPPRTRGSAAHRACYDAAARRRREARKAREAEQASRSGSPNRPDSPVRMSD